MENLTTNHRTFGTPNATNKRTGDNHHVSRHNYAISSVVRCKTTLGKAPVAQDKSFAPFFANSSRYWGYNVLHIFINTARLTAVAVNFKSAIACWVTVTFCVPNQKHTALIRGRQ